MAFKPLEFIKTGSKFSPQGQIAGRTYGIAKKLSLGTGAIFGAIMLYFLKLGAAAAKGAIIGATVGGTSGAVAGGVIGFHIGVALAPFTFGLSIPIMTALGATTGAFVGATVGAVTGGLIGLGLASGSATAMSMGVGAGVGGTVGAVAGYVAGATVGALLLAGCSFLIAACLALAPVVIPISAAIGGIVGAYIGSAIGAAIGYAFGHYVVGTIGVPATASAAGAAIGFAVGGPAGAAVGAGIGWLATGGWRTAWEFVRNAFKTTTGGPVPVGVGIGNTLSGVLATIGNLITGIASTIWGGVTSAAGGAFSFLSSAANLVVGGLGSLPVPAAMVILPVGGAVSLVGIGGILVTTFTATSLSTIEQDTSLQKPGENQFFTIVKSAQQSHLENPPPDQELAFTITLTAKDKNLTNITVTDELKVQSATTSFNVTTDRDGNLISPIPCPPNLLTNEKCSYSFTIIVNTSFTDAVIANTATVKATPQDQPEVTDSVSATASVGTPPAQCPRGWPSIGDVTQGPEGGTSHGPGGYEAIDIGQGAIGGVGKPVYATVEGTIVESFINNGNSLDQRIAIQPTACAGLDIVYYWHLSARNVNVGQIVTWSQVIGATGQAGTGPHIHYQFNRSGTRSFPMDSPYIPRSVPRSCDSPQVCAVSIGSAP